MKEYIKVFSSVSDYNTFKASASYYTPNISYISGIDVVLYNPIIEYLQVPLLANVKNYLTFIAQANGTFQFSSAVDYSVDNGITWSTLASNTSSPTVAAGSKIMWKATLTPTSSGIGTFSSTANFIIQGNVMSLLYGDNFPGQLDLTGKDYAFKDLFTGCTGITNAYKLSLPATTLSEGCYKNMFKNCTGMVIAPILLAVTLADSCYSNMFYGCTSLVEAPELSAATLTNNCYEYMFYGCSSLTDIKCLATDITATDCTTNWVNGVASSGTFVKDSTMSSWTTGNDGIPTNWTTTGYQDDYSQEYLTFEVLEPGAFSFKSRTSLLTIHYSTDNGTTWDSLNDGDYTETLQAGTKVLWKGTFTPNTKSTGIGYFISSGNFNVSGNILSIVYGDSYTSHTTMTSYDYDATSASLFLELFKNCKIIRSNKLQLPSNTSYRCYDAMFSGCSRLITTPKLPATTMQPNCYASMFKNCTSLVIPPELNATSLAVSCYQGMFDGCTSLLHAQSILPATTLKNGCYAAMFRGCTSLISGPELPANNVPTVAYKEMFKGCTALEIAPDLPATTVEAITYAYESSSAYWEIFYGCSSLIYVKCLARAESAINLYTYLSGVASNGTFVKAVGQSYTNYSIPSTWTVIEV